jgi:hypothetical protein
MQPITVLGPPGSGIWVETSPRIPKAQAQPLPLYQHSILFRTSDCRILHCIIRDRELRRTPHSALKTLLADG